MEVLGLFTVAEAGWAEAIVVIAESSQPFSRNLEVCEPLVMMQDDRDGIPDGGRVFEDDLADPRVLDDGPPFGRRERGGLVEDLEYPTADGGHLC